jgi:hypothetical protein
MSLYPVTTGSLTIKGTDTCMADLPHGIGRRLGLVKLESTQGRMTYLQLFRNTADLSSKSGPPDPFRQQFPSLLRHARPLKFRRN